MGCVSLEFFDNFFNDYEVIIVLWSTIKTSTDQTIITNEINLYIQC